MHVQFGGLARLKPILQMQNTPLLPNKHNQTKFMIDNWVYFDKHQIDNNVTVYITNITKAVALQIYRSELKTRTHKQVHWTR